jgi:YD repeat-containing protein
VFNIKSTGDLISSFQYKYDDAGNRIAVAESGGDRVTWAYDNTSQLINEHRSGANAYNTTFVYDPLGNRLLKNETGVRTTSSYDAANQLERSEEVSGLTTYTFDSNGNQHEVTAPSGSRTTYQWDYENQLTEIRRESGTPVTMVYNADLRRVKTIQ